jgi:hypothetical protein
MTTVSPDADDRSALPDNTGCVRGSSSEPRQQSDLVAGPSPSAGLSGALCEPRAATRMECDDRRPCHWTSTTPPSTTASSPPPSSERATRSPTQSRPWTLQPCCRRTSQLGTATGPRSNGVDGSARWTCSMSAGRCGGEHWMRVGTMTLRSSPWLTTHTSRSAERCPGCSTTSRLPGSAPGGRDRHGARHPLVHEDAAGEARARWSRVSVRRGGHLRVNRRWS